MTTQDGNQTNIAVIGYGFRLRAVIRLLIQADVNKRLCIRGVFDPLPRSRQAAVAEFGPDVREYASVDAAVADPRVDWVLIGSWNRYHAEQIIAALKAGKHVFCEKPLATSLADCLRVREVVRASDRQFVFGLVLRYSPHYQQVKSLLSAGRIGRPVSFEFNETLALSHGNYIFGNWRRQHANAGSHILEKCCHDLDIANWFIESLPTRVASFGARSFFTAENAALRERLAEQVGDLDAFRGFIDPERVDAFDGSADILDNQVVILEYANGVRGTFHTNVASAMPERRFHILGDEGSLRADGYRGTISHARFGDRVPTEITQSLGRDGHGGGDEILAEHLLATILNGRAPLAGIDEALHSAAVAFAIDQAQATGRVTDLAATWQQLT